jgi:hypothetical protein
MTDLSPWTGLAGVVIGYAGTLWGEARRDRRAADREREARREDRDDDRARREAERADARQVLREQFQRETLLQLQEAVQQVARSAGHMHHFDVVASRSTGQWGKNLYPEDVSDHDLEVTVRLLILTARVQDDQLRALLEEFRSLNSSYVAAKSEQAAQRVMDRSMAQYGVTVARLGELLRALH